MPLSDAGPMSPDARRRRTAGLMAAQFDRPTPQDTAVVERGGLLPFGTYANGMTGPAIPGFITQPFESATTGDLLFANGGRPGAAVGAVSTADIVRALMEDDANKYRGAI